MACNLDNFFNHLEAHSNLKRVYKDDLPRRKGIFSHEYLDKVYKPCETMLPSFEKFYFRVTLKTVG